jgi:PadR family transcriptional regulator, regulatory protein PadR
MDAQFKKGVLEIIVLNLLLKKDYYGYELVDEMSKEISISEGTIYPLLTRLVKFKYVTTYLKESKLGPARKYYKLSSRGKERARKIKNTWILFSKRVNNMLKNNN